MGIYTDCSLFGIRIYVIDDDDFYTITLFELKQDVLMSDEQIKKVYLFYEKSENKEKLLFQIYTNCSSTLYEKGVFKMWYKIETSNFLQLFNDKNILLKKQLELIMS